MEASLFSSFGFRRIITLLCLATCFAIGISPRTHATEDSSSPSFYIDPVVGFGFNAAQGTAVRFGLDLGAQIDRNLYGGVGAYYAAGERPQHDREIGSGPFVGYAHPLFKFLSAHARQDLVYVDLYDPYLIRENPDSYGHTSETGVNAITSFGLHLSFNRNFGVGFGYRFVLAMSNSKTDDGRSGTFFGLSIGF